MVSSYQNGNYKVDLYGDGTRIRTQNKEIGRPLRAEFPDNLDVKITQFCDSKAGCMAHCHERSNPKGLAGDLNLGLKVLSRLKGGEIAVGGGSTLSHPELPAFLRGLNEANLVANLTVNQFHLQTQLDQLNRLATQGLFYGLGLSYVKLPFNRAKEVQARQTIWHLIIGVHTVEDLQKILDNFENPRVLLLGYKKFGNGIKYHNPLIDKEIHRWYCRLHEFFNKNGLILGFDNLSVEQLGIKRFFTQEKWNTFYQGNDGFASCYFDLVKREYTISSRSEKRFPLKEDIKFDEIMFNINS